MNFVMNGAALLTVLLAGQAAFAQEPKKESSFKWFNDFPTLRAGEAFIAVPEGTA